MPLTNLQNTIFALKVFDIEKETISIINNNSEYLSFLLKEQLRIGRDGDDKPVTLKRRGGVYNFYSDRTVFNKEFNGIGLGKETDVITNYMSGTFYHSIVVRTSGTEFEMFSDVPYFPDILFRSGTKIMELNSKHLQIFAENILITQLRERFNQLEHGI